MNAADEVAAARRLRARNLRTLGALATLFMLPLAVAFFTYYATSWRPAGSVNHGVLITPVRTLTMASVFRGHWSLVYIGDGTCAAECRQVLTVMRQTRLGLNNDMPRVARVFLVTANCCLPEVQRQHPGLRVLDATDAAGVGLVRQFPVAGRAHSLYVVDPLANLMMSYDARQNPHGLLEDLKKLLRLSHIG
ncbi:MAG: hypothetical protein PVS2B3_12140 [Steroidobacteraceae bacterium]